MLYITVMLGFLFFAAVAMTINEGLWNNAILLFNIIFAGLLGIVVGIPLGVWLLEKSGKPDEFAWHFVLAGIWGVFALSVFLFGLAAKSASGVRVRFIRILENLGGPVIGLMVAVMFTSFTAYTLERVPIAAGEWKLSDASDTQRNILRLARAPFLNVTKNFVVSEGADSPFYDNKRRSDVIKNKSSKPANEKPASPEAANVPVAK